MGEDSLRTKGQAGTSAADLTLRGLRVFMAVVECGSVGGAARQLGGSTSGVSQQITALEQAVGAKLFDRRIRPLKLTPAGLVLRRHAYRVLETVADAQAELADLNLAALPQLSLAIIDDLDASLTPALVTSLNTRYRNCYISTFSGRSDWVTERLERREADIAVSGIVPDDANDFRSIPILREPFVLVTAKDVLRSEGNVRDQLAELPFVQYSESMPIGRLVAQHLNRLRFNAKRQFSFEASRSVFAIVAQLGGWTLATPLNLLDAESFVPQVDVLPLPFPAFSRRIWLIARTGELGRLPERLAGNCRRLVAEQLVTRFASIAPTMTGAIEVLEE